MACNKITNYFKQRFCKFFEAQPKRPLLSKKEAFVFLVYAVYSLLNRIRVDPGHFTVERSAVFNVDHRSLFDFINHAATVERWFQWVSHYQSLDRRPLGVGKQFRAYFYIPYMGYEKMDFRVANYSADSRVVLKSSHILRPELGVSVVPLEREYTMLTISVSFHHESLLYQITVGAYLRYLARKNTEDALILLSSIR